MLTKKDWQDAYDVQNACNLSGVVHDFSRIVVNIWKEANETGKGTDWVNTHPICILFADKIASLTGVYDSEIVWKAYDAYHEAINALTR